MRNLKLFLIGLLSILLMLVGGIAVPTVNTAMASTQSERHDCETHPVGFDGACLNYGHRFIPKYTSSGYIHNCWSPPGSDNDTYLAIFILFVGHTTVWQLKPGPKAGHSFHSPEEQGVWRVWTNEHKMNAWDIVWETQMVNDGDPPGTQWTYEVDQYCIENCGCKMDQGRTKHILEFLKARRAFLHPNEA